MKRFVVPLFALLALSLPVVASAQLVDNFYRWDYKQVYFRNTSAATGSVVQDLNWAKGSPGNPGIGYVDSLVARRAGANAVGAPDTTIAYDIRQFLMPDIGRKGATALVDTSTTVWLEIVGEQDTLSYSWTGATVLDSMQVAAEYSYDGSIWYSACCADPTVAFDATAPIPINGTDGATPEPILAVEIGNSESARVVLKCDPHTSVLGVGAYIINRTLCLCSAKYVRFLIGFPGGGGQFKARIGYWRET